jgi:hypothetical protein
VKFAILVLAFVLVAVLEFLYAESILDVAHEGAFVKLGLGDFKDA